MQPEHRIDELIVDLSFTTTRLARHEKALLSNWLSEDLLPALDQLFSRYSPGKQVLRFETLEFDFGNLTNRNYQQSIREQLLQKFAQLLQTQLLAVAPTPTSLSEHAKSGDNSNARVALTQLFNYLASGQLSAHQPFERQTRPHISDATRNASVNRPDITEAATENSAEKNAAKKNTVKQSIVKDSDTTYQRSLSSGTSTDADSVKKSSKPIFNQNALHEQLLDVVIARHNIAELLRELPQRDVLIQRLLTQFSVPQRLELLRQLAPQQIQNAIALLDLLQFFESHAINSVAQQLDSDVVWQALLHLGLEHPHANVDFWLRHIFRIVAANAAIDVNLLQQHLVAIKIPFSSAATPLINLQTQIAQLSVSENSSTNKPSVIANFSTSFSVDYTGEPDVQANVQQINSGQPTPEQSNPKLSNPGQANQGQFNSEQSNPEQLRQLIAAAFICADASQLQQLWPQLIANEPQLLLAALEHYLPQAEIRQHLMLRLPLVLQADIIVLLAPALKKLFLQLHSNAGQLMEWLSAPTAFSPVVASAGATGNAGISDYSPELLLRQLWEIALGLIIKNQSTLANTDYSKDSDLFLMSMAARYADLHNLDRNFVQQAFDSLLNQPQINENTVRPEQGSSETSNYGNGSYENARHEITSHSAYISGVNSLNSISDHQLFDLCLRLKSGALAWASLANDVPLLRRLISSYIRLGHSATAENCADFVAAINAQAESSNAPSAFYLAVLQTLIADKLIDLEAIALGIQRSDKSSQLVLKRKIETREEIEMIEDAAVQASALGNAEVSAANTDPVVSVVKQSQLDALAVQLQQGKIKPESLNLTVDQVAQLIDIFITIEKTIAPDIQADLIAAIHQQALHAIRKADYYQRVLSMLVRKEMLDLMQVREQVNQQAIAQPITPTVIASINIEAIVQTLLAESAPERLLQALQLDLAQWQSVVAELIQKAQFVDKDSSVELIDAIQRQSHEVIHPAYYYRLVIAAVLARATIDLEAFTRAANSSTELMPARLPANPQNITPRVSSLTTSATNIKVIAQEALLAGSPSWTGLQQLQLDDRQWARLSTELIQQSQFTDQHSAAELIEAIQTQARVAITPAVYYRRVIQAVLQQHPIDLEVFAAEALNAEQFNTAAFDAAQIDTSQINTLQANTRQINATQFSSDDISQNNIHPNHVNPNHINPDQAMDYPLLTGSDNSLRKPALSLAQLLAAELPLNQEQLLALQQHINALLNRSNRTLIIEWCELLATAQHAQVLIQSVPAHLLHQIAMRLQAGRYTWLDALVKLVMEALALLVADINNLAIKKAKWEFVFSCLFASDNTNNNTTETSARALELSIALCEQLASAAAIDDVQRLVNLTQRRIALLKPPAQQKPAMRLQDISTNPATHSDATTPQWEAGLHINNAGQVLAAAFLPRLFSMLNLMQDGKFIHPGAADRAVHLVQFMVTGQSATPEYELILNKVLCGIGTSIPVSAGIEITEQERTLIEQMLNSMIQHWKVLGSTSITGLRETFFQRQGWLVLEEDCWRLKVKEQTFDLLLDRLPWSISLIKHGWMDKPVRVSWRNHS